MGYTSKHTYKFDALRLLFVEDSPYMLEILETICQAMGVRDICKAENVQAGIKALRDFNPNVIITDWHMGPPDGLDFVRFLRTSPDSPSPYLPILMLTGHGDKQHVQEARDAGVNMFLAKPVTAKALFKRLVWIIENPLPFIKTKEYFGPDRRRENVGRREGDRRFDGWPGA